MVHPDSSDRGFTGHKQANTGSGDLGLIYMNARYYLPEVGRFVSADTIVPEAEEPQSLTGDTLPRPFFQAGCSIFHKRRFSVARA